MAGESTFFFMDSFLVKLIPVSKVRIVAFWFWHWTSSDDISGKIEMQRILWCIYFKVHSRWLLLVLDKLWKGWVHLGQCRGWSPVASTFSLSPSCWVAVFYIPQVVETVNCVVQFLHKLELHQGLKGVWFLARKAFPAQVPHIIYIRVPMRL